jgi:hypothetical protein
MQADLPFYESPDDALRAAIQALGGYKQVGALIWPDKTPDNAGRLLADCVNTARSEKLELTQVLRIFVLARDKGFHEPFVWFAGEAGYEARAVTRAEEVDRVTTVIEQSSKTLAAALGHLERLQRARSVA